MIGGNDSCKPPRAPQTLQDTGKSPNLLLGTTIVTTKMSNTHITILTVPSKWPIGEGRQPDKATVEVEALFEGIDFSEQLTRARFEETSDP